MSRIKTWALAGVVAFFVMLNIWWLSQWLYQRGAGPEPQVYRLAYETPFVVPVRIADKDYNFLLDTGSTMTVLDERIARQLTIEMDRVQFDRKRAYRTLEGVKSRAVHLFQPLPMSLGPYRLAGQDAWIGEDLSSISKSLGVPISGLLGVDTYRQFSWRLFTQDKRLEISRAPVETGSFDECLGYTDEQRWQPVLTLEIGGEQVMMPLDTSTPRSYVAKVFVEHLQSAPGVIEPRPGKEKVASVTGFAESPRYVIQDVMLGALPVGKVHVHQTAKVYGLGTEVLTRFDHVALIPSKMMLCFSGAHPLE